MGEPHEPADLVDGGAVWAPDLERLCATRWQPLGRNGPDSADARRESPMRTGCSVGCLAVIAFCAIAGVSALQSTSDPAVAYQDFGLAILGAVVLWLGLRSTRAQTEPETAGPLVFDNAVVSDPSAREYSLGTFGSLLLTNDEIVVDYPGRKAHIRLDAVTGIRIDASLGNTVDLEIQYPGGPFRVDTYGWGRQLEAFRDDALARVAAKRAAAQRPDETRSTPTTLAGELAEIGRLHDSGVLDDEEFRTAKRRALNPNHE